MSELDNCRPRHRTTSVLCRAVAPQRLHTTGGLLQHHPPAKRTHTNTQLEKNPLDTAMQTCFRRGGQGEVAHRNQLSLQLLKLSGRNSPAALWFPVIHHPSRRDRRARGTRRDTSTCPRGCSAPRASPTPPAESPHGPPRVPRTSAPR